MRAVFKYDSSRCSFSIFSESGEDQPKPEDTKIFSDEDIANIVDVVLKENDQSQDGYITYHEFKQAQNRERQQSNAQPPAP